MSLIPNVNKDPQVILKTHKTELQNLLLKQFLHFKFNYTGRINFSFGNGRFFLDFYCSKYWYSLSDKDLLILEAKGTEEIAYFETPGVSDDEYFNLIVSDVFLDLIKTDNAKVLKDYVENVVIPVSGLVYDKFL